MRQPTKDTLREQLALAADEIMRLRSHNESLQAALRFVQPRRWWHRFWRRA